MITPSGGSNLDQNLYRTGFDANWEIDVFGGVRRSVEAADATIEVTIEDRRDVLVTLLGEVAKNYIDLRGFQRHLVASMVASAASTLRRTPPKTSISQLASNPFW